MGKALERKAMEFAKHYHGIIDHRRKYTGEPYIAHLASVAEIVRSVPHTQEMLAAAWLHDVVEDTPARIQEVRDTFGDGVAVLVEMLTSVSRPEDGNRARRKAIDLAHIAGASREAKTVKLADIIDNARSIARHDPVFARLYLSEKSKMLCVLRDGDPTLWGVANSVIAESCAALSGFQERLENAA